MFEFIENIQVWHELHKNLKELKSIQEEAQRIDGKLQKYIEENEQVLSNEDQNVITIVVNNQENGIINEIQDLENRFNQFLGKSFDQLSQQGEDRQLVPIYNEQSSDTLGNNISTIQALASRDYTRNKTISEYLRGVPKGKFDRKKMDRDAIFFAVLDIAKILIVEADKWMSSYVKDLAIQYEEELKKTQGLLAELRKKIERYYSRFTPIHKKKKLLLTSGITLFILLLISWYFLGLF